MELEVEDTTGDRSDDSGYVGYRPTMVDALQYVSEAVNTWGGQRHPTDPFFDPKKVAVKIYREKA